MIPRYIAAQTAGVTKDYTWHSGDNQGADQHLLLKKFVDDTSPSVAVCRTGEKWGCLIAGIRSSSTDFRGRNNRVNVAFCGIERDEARALAVSALRDWDGCSKELLRAFDWAGAKSERGWDVDFLALDASSRRFMQVQISTEVSALQKRLERKNTPDQWSRLADEIKTHTFSGTDGIKLVVTGAPSDPAYKEMLENAERVVWTGASATDVDLDESKKKLEREKSSPSTRSRQPSTTPSSGPLSSPSDSATPSRNGLWITCGIVGAIIILLILGGGHKKKEIERLEFTEVASKALLIVTTFREVSAEDTKQAARVETPPNWSAEGNEWNLAGRSWSVRLTPPSNKAEGKIVISYPFDVEKRLPKTVSPPGWKIQAEYKGNEMILSIARNE